MPKIYKTGTEAPRTVIVIIYYKLYLEAPLGKILNY
jgi:hypothetical protein